MCHQDSSWDIMCTQCKLCPRGSQQPGARPFWDLNCYKVAELVDLLQTRGLLTLLKPPLLLTCFKSCGSTRSWCLLQQYLKDGCSTVCSISSNATLTSYIWRLAESEGRWEGLGWTREGLLRYSRSSIILPTFCSPDNLKHRRKCSSVKDGSKSVTLMSCVFCRCAWNSPKGIRLFLCLDQTSVLLLHFYLILAATVFLIQRRPFATCVTE